MLPSTPSVAVLDVGSNTLKLLVAAPGEPIQVLHQKTLETRISEGTGGETPHLSDTALELGVRGVRRLLREAEIFKPLKTLIAATSAVREADNRDVFSQRIEEATGLPLAILNGEEEARAIAMAIRRDPALGGVGAFFMADIGGGSLELAHYRHPFLLQTVSLPLGAVRLTARFLTSRDDPIRPEAAASISRTVEKAIANSNFVFSGPALPWIGCGGAFSCARAILNRVSETGLEESPSLLTLPQLRRLFSDLSRLNLRERRKTPYLPEARADIFPTALQILITLSEVAAIPSFTHSLYNLRFGLAAALLAKV